MSAHSASIARRHIENQAPTIHDTFLCRVCGLSKSIMGRKLREKIGMRRIWQYAACAVVAKEASRG